MTLLRLPLGGVYQLRMPTSASIGGTMSASQDTKNLSPGTIYEIEEQRGHIYGPSRSPPLDIAGAEWFPGRAIVAKTMQSIKCESSGLCTARSFKQSPELPSIP